MEQVRIDVAAREHGDGDLTLTSILAGISAASATAPPGSTRASNSPERKATRAATSSRCGDALPPGHDYGKRSSPGVRAIKASQMVSAQRRIALGASRS